MANKLNQAKWSKIDQQMIRRSPENIQKCSSLEKQTLHSKWLILLKNLQNENVKFLTFKNGSTKSPNFQGKKIVENFVLKTVKQKIHKFKNIWGKKWQNKDEKTFMVHRQNQ